MTGFLLLIYSKCLSYYLKDTNIFLIILPFIDQYVRYTFKTNEELKQATNKKIIEKHGKLMEEYGYLN